jgi:hypothetical protein
MNPADTGGDRGVSAPQRASWGLQTLRRVGRLLGAARPSKTQDVDAESAGLTEERRALVHRYMVDAETAASRGPHAAVNLLPRSAEAPLAADRGGTAAVTTPDTPRPEVPVVAATRDRTTQRIGRATLNALLLLSAAVGLMLVSAADALSRSGHPHGAVLFWLGLLAIFVPVTARLTSPSPSRNERVALLVLLGLASYLVKVFRDPFRFLYADEFVHQYNALSIVSTHSLFRENPILPATAAYPGLESPTAALSALTGLSTFAAGLVVIAVARLIMMFALFLLYEAVTGSGRVAGLAAAFYAASPHYLFFIADYSYESFALPIAILALAAALRARPPSGAGSRAWLIVALILTAGVVITHHMTSYALIVTLLAICLIPLPWLHQRTRRPWTVAIVAIAMTAGWLVLVARKTLGYLSPVVLGALRETIRTVQGESQVRQLFGSSGHAAQGPGWEHLVAFASAVLVAVAVPFGARTVWRRYRDRPAALVFVVAAVGYVVSLTLRLVPAAWESAARASEFLFIGAGFTLALCTLWLLERYPGFAARAGLVGAAVVLVIGGVISTTSGSTRLAQPYRVSVRGASLEPQAATVAQWARKTLGGGNRIAAEAADGRFFLVDGRQHVFVGNRPPIATILRTKPLYRWQIAVLRRYGIRYVVTDAQPSSMDISDGYYFFPGNDSHTGLAVAGKKFRRAGAAPIYDSGDVVVYDLEGASLTPS